jgi:hypothetical protein
VTPDARNGEARPAPRIQEEAAAAEADTTAVAIVAYGMMPIIQYLAQAHDSLEGFSKAQLGNYVFELA